MDTAYLTLKDAVSDVGLALPQALLEVQPSALAPAAENPDISHPEDKEPAPGPSARNADGAAQPPESEPSKQDGNKFSISLKIPSLFWKILAVVVVAGGSGTFAVLVFKRRRAQEEAALLERRRRRAERLKETGISEADFDLMMQQKRISSPERERKAPAGKGRKRK